MKVVSKTTSIIASLVAILAFFGIREYTDLLPNKYSPLLAATKMELHITECSDPKFAAGKLIGYYDIKFERDGNLVHGKGIKHSQLFHGEFLRYSKTFDIEISGKVENGELIAKVFEENSKQTHRREGSIRLNMKTLEGTMNIGWYNCTGILKVK